MVHNLTDRDLWRRQGEAYLRKFRNNAHPLVASAHARRAAELQGRNEKPAA